MRHPPFPHREITQACEHATASLLALRNASLFLTGGTGFVGRWLMALLLYANRAHDLRLTVWVLTRDASRFHMLCPELAADPSVTLVEGDVRTFAFPPRAFTHVIHGGADLGSGDGEAETILAGTNRVIEFSRSMRARRLLYLSSGGVYGSGAFRESAEAIPSTSYGRGKKRAEENIRAAQSTADFEAVSARIFSLVGPGMELGSHFALGNFIGDALEGRSITIRSDGTAIRSYLFAADLAAWLITLLVNGRGGEVYNVGSDRAVSIAEVAAIVAAVVPGATGVSAPGEPRPEERPRYVPSIALARQELGLEPWTSLEDAIRKTAEWSLVVRADRKIR